MDINYIPIIVGPIIGLLEHILVLPLRNKIDFYQYYHNYNRFNNYNSINKSINIRGIYPMIIGISISHIGLYYCLEKAKETKECSYYGILGRTIHDSIMIPTDIIRLHMNIKNINMYCAIKKIYQKNGICGYYKGIIPIMMINIPSSLLDFNSFVYFRNNELNIIQSSCLTGLINSTILTPIDTIKTCMQLSNKKIKTTIYDIYINRGIIGFWRGSHLRFTQGLISYGIYEYLSEFIK